jgi:hypothetical protein
MDLSGKDEKNEVGGWTMGSRGECPRHSNLQKTRSPFAAKLPPPSIEATFVAGVAEFNAEWYRQLIDQSDNYPVVYQNPY